MRLAIILTSGWLLSQMYFCDIVSGDSSYQETIKDSPTNKSGVAWNATYNDNLKRDLFVNYNKFTHPLQNNEPSETKLGLTVRHIDIDEVKGQITIYGWLKMEWYDDKFQWNPAEYGNVASMHVVPEDVWRPDIALFNSATDRDDHLGGSQLIINHKGSILWVPPAVFTAFCSLNLQLWPFDTQLCHLKIGSWSLTDIKLGRYGGPDTAAEVDSIVENSEWMVEIISTTFETDQFYNFAKFQFKLVRRASMYKALIFVPASCIVLMVLSSFWLPPQMGEKLLLNGIVIVVVAAFLMYFAQLLPILAQDTPLVVLFYSSTLLLVSISTIISVVVLYLSSAKHHRRVPSFLRKILNGSLSYLLCLSHLTPIAEAQGAAQKEMTNQNIEFQGAFEDQQSTFSESIRTIQFDWIVLATAVDRFFFLIYCIVFIILAVVYSV